VYFVVCFGIMVPLLRFYAMHTGASAFEVGLLLSVYSLSQLFAISARAVVRQNRSQTGASDQPA
jgi:VIT1/CCC1 family predicted Fe2+/Mn2+ transporter